MYYSPYTCKIYFQKVSLFFYIIYIHFLKKLSGQKHTVKFYVICYYVLNSFTGQTKK